MKSKSTIIYSITHFIVDMLCCFLIMAIAIYTNTNISMENMSIIFIVYNFFAFAMEFPIGKLADKINKNHEFSIIGLSLVLISLIIGLLVIHIFELLTSEIIFILLSVVSGIGNAMFHVGAGINILRISENKASLPGIFVSTGASGLFLGNILSNEYNNISVWVWVMFIGLINLLMLFIVDIDISIDTYKEKEKKKVDTSYKEEILLLLFMTVCIRGFVGTVTKFNWNSNILMGFLLVMCITFGKMFGGIIGDKIGFKKLSLISLGGASILFLFGNKFIICGLLAQFLFNMTMPITLTLMVNMFQNQKGKMFGLTTLALFIGFMVSLIFNTSLSEFMFIQFISCIVSLIFMIVGVQLYNQNFDKSSNKKKMEGVKND